MIRQTHSNYIIVFNPASAWSKTIFLLFLLNGTLPVAPLTFSWCFFATSIIKEVELKKCKHCGLLVKSVKSNPKTLSQNTQYYQVVRILAKKGENYKSNPEKQQALSKSIQKNSRLSLKKHIKLIQTNSRLSLNKTIELIQTNSRLSLNKTIELIQTNSRLSLKTIELNPDKYKALSKQNYRANRDNSL